MTVITFSSFCWLEVSKFPEKKTGKPKQICRKERKPAETLEKLPQKKPAKLCGNHADTHAKTKETRKNLKPFTKCLEALGKLLENPAETHRNPSETRGNP